MAVGLALGDRLSRRNYAGMERVDRRHPARCPACCRALGVRGVGEWASLALGVWLAVSPWVLQVAANVSAMWTHVVLGLLVAAVSAWALWDNQENPHAHA